MTDSETRGAQAAATVGEARAFIRSIVGTGIRLPSLLLTLIGLLVQLSAATKSTTSTPAYECPRRIALPCLMRAHQRE